VDAKHSHPLRRIGCAATLTHTSSAEGSEGGEIEPALDGSRAREANDFVRGCRIVGRAIHELVRQSDFQQSAVHHESANGTPTLRTWVGPDEYTLPGGSVVAHCPHQVGSPHPGAGEEHD